MAKRSQPKFLTTAAAARVLCVPAAQIAALAGRGLIGQRYLPGIRGRWNRADVERLAAQSVLPIGQKEAPCAT